MIDKPKMERVEALPILQPCEALSINTAEELSQVEGEMRRMGFAL